MPHLSPQTLTQAEQRSILRATAKNPRDHLIYSLALGTGLRLAEIVGLNVGDVYTTEGRPRNRVRLRPEIAKGGPLCALLLAEPGAHLTAAGPVRRPDLADAGRVRSALPATCPQA